MLDRGVSLFLTCSRNPYSKSNFRPELQPSMARDPSVTVVMLPIDKNRARDSAWVDDEFALGIVPRTGCANDLGVCVDDLVHHGVGGQLVPLYLSVIRRPVQGEFLGDVKIACPR